MIALGRGAQESVKQRNTSLGTTLLTVFPGQARGGGGGPVASATDRARLLDYLAHPPRKHTPSWYRDPLGRVQAAR